MTWAESSLGQWIDRKVIELGMPASAVLLSDIRHHELNMDILMHSGLAFFWFIRTSTPYSFDLEPIYFVSALGKEEGDQLIRIFQDSNTFNYARFFVGPNPIKAIQKQSSNIGAVS